MINQVEIYPSYYGEISLDPRLSFTVKMHGRAINKLIKVLMSFIILICLLIEKTIKLDKVTLFMSYIQL